ncbi:hypothetical protein BKA66DRAFT_470043 [Pyrenochaeta sp. MPI-SDFR-AT-0127]|nr:hypothetical protein BKA66DRAFT_470043 [Pyrenochaeta sp. MPI-SDFR-AT-0127]
MPSTRHSVWRPNHKRVANKTMILPSNLNLRSITGAKLHGGRHHRAEFVIFPLASSESTHS